MHDKLKITAAIALAISTMGANAAGFFLADQSATANGRSYAGSGIVGDDASAAWFNPAAMTILPGTRLQAGSSWIDCSFKYNGDNGTHENGRLKSQLVPFGYLTHQIDENIWFGLALTVPYGLGTEYKRNWEHANRGSDAWMLTLDINPSIGIRVNDMLSLGAGVSMQYAHAKLGMRAGSGPMSMHGRIDADSLEFGYNLGLMLTPLPNVRVGLSYRSAMSHTADGDIKIDTPNPVLRKMLLGGKDSERFDTTVRLKTPATVSLSSAWDVNDKWTLSSMIRWCQWSNFKNIDIQTDFPLMAKHSLVNNWRDTWFFALGADYRVNDKWTVRGGVAWEQNPISQPDKRTATIPDAERMWFSLGATYRYSNAVRFDLALTYLDAIGHDRLWSDTKENGGKEVGRFNSHCVIGAAQVQYLF